MDNITEPSLSDLLARLEEQSKKLEAIKDTAPADQVTKAKQQLTKTIFELNTVLDPHFQPVLNYIL